VLARDVCFQLIHKPAVKVDYFTAIAAFKMKMLIAIVRFINISVKYLFAVFAARAQNLSALAKLGNKPVNCAFADSLARKRDGYFLRRKFLVGVCAQKAEQNFAL
jgi:hypothetical protein